MSEPEVVIRPIEQADLDCVASVCWDDRQTQTRLLESRRVELHGLCDPAVKEAFERHGVRLTHYGKLR